MPLPPPSAGLFRQKMGPLGALIDPPRYVPPELSLPPLEQITVQVPSPTAPSLESMTRELLQRARRLAPRRERSRGEAVHFGDDVCLDLVLMHGDAFVPFALTLDDWRELRAFPGFPGLAEGIASHGLTHQCVQVDLVLPADFPLASYRGVAARCTVGIQRAIEVRVPDLTHPDFIASMGLGATLDAMCEGLIAESLAAARSSAVVDRYLVRTLAGLTTWDVPIELVDFEVLTRWAEAQGRALVERKFSAEQQRELLGHWLQAPWVRAEAVERLKGTAALLHLAKREGFEVNRERHNALLIRPAAAFGLQEVDVASALARSGPDVGRRVRELATLEGVLEQVRGRVKVVFQQGVRVQATKP